MSPLEILVRQYMDARERVARVELMLETEKTILHGAQLNLEKHMEKKSQFVLGRRITKVKNYRPSIHRWGDFLRYVQNTGQYELMTRAVNTKNIQQLWKKGVVVPGVVKFPVTSIQVKEQQNGTSKQQKEQVSEGPGPL